MRIVAISDTHGYHDRVSIPEGDLLIHGGDLSNSGTLIEMERFNAFLEKLPHPHKVVIAGNHDFALERQAPEAEKLLTACHYLKDRQVVVEGLKIYGSPWQPWFFDWAFNLRRGSPLAEKWAQIPNDTDILVTHGPPQGILDLTHDGRRVGCEELAKRVQEVRPQAHIFGHIHEAYGSLERYGTTFYNASLYNHFEKRYQPAWVFDLQSNRNLLARN